MRRLSESPRGVEAPLPIGEEAAGLILRRLMWAMAKLTRIQIALERGVFTEHGRTGFHFFQTFAVMQVALRARST
jgi:hypothetical protein